MGMVDEHLSAAGYSAGIDLALADGQFCACALPTRGTAATPGTNRRRVTGMIFPPIERYRLDRAYNRPERGQAAARR
jgi:hypothetical protein